jgi:hypothetical protein
MQMKHVKYLAFLSTLALLFPVGALARDKNERTVDIPDSVQVGAEHLKPGDYKVEWQGDGPAVQVRFFQGRNLVATVPGTLKTNDREVTQDDVVVQNKANGKVLMEIDFGRGKEAIILGQG